MLTSTKTRMSSLEGIAATGVETESERADIAAVCVIYAMKLEGLV